MKLIKCDEKIMSILPRIFPILFEEFGEDIPLEMYACYDERKKPAFFAKSGNKCLYIIGDYHRKFEVDGNGELSCFYGDEYKAIFRDRDMLFIDANGVQYSLFVDYFNEMDREASRFDGKIIFSQYREKDDSLCRMEYLYEKGMGGKINSFNMKDPCLVHLEKNCSVKNDSKEYGLTSKSVLNYRLHTFESGDIGYGYVRMREEGFVSWLAGIFYNNRDSILQRFTEAKYVFRGMYLHILPICKMFKTGEVKQFVRNKKFLVEVPMEMLSIYNGTDNDIIRIREFLASLEFKNTKKDYCFVMSAKNTG